LREVNVKKTLVQKIMFIVKEIVSNWSMMVRVALYDQKIKNKDGTQKI